MSMFPITCAYCGQKVMGATFQCLAAWCDECHPKLGDEKIVAMSHVVEQRLKAVRRQFFREEIDKLKAAAVTK